MNDKRLFFIAKKMYTSCPILILILITLNVGHKGYFFINSILMTLTSVRECETCQRLHLFLCSCPTGGGDLRRPQTAYILKERALIFLDFST